MNIPINFAETRKKKKKIVSGEWKGLPSERPMVKNLQLNVQLVRARQRRGTRQKNDPPNVLQNLTRSFRPGRLAVLQHVSLVLHTEFFILT